MIKTYYMKSIVKVNREERRNMFENILLEAVASLFVGSLLFICFWILFKS
jgi:hypothetical protein